MNKNIRSRKYEKGYAIDLLTIAEGDLDSAQILLANRPKRIANIFILATQAIEKAMKAVMCHSGLPIVLTHDLLILLSMLPDNTQFPFGSEIGDLTEFATTRRYEDGKIILEAEEAEGVVEIAKQVLDWAAGCIKNKS